MVWHPLSREGLCAELATDPASGLTDEEVRRRLLAHGPNELPAAAPISPYSLWKERVPRPKRLSWQAWGRRVRQRLGGGLV
jgi:magnesium-transporting ATPase (P-type)